MTGGGEGFEEWGVEGFVRFGSFGVFLVSLVLRWVVLRFRVVGGVLLKVEDIKSFFFFLLRVALRWWEAWFC